MVLGAPEADRKKTLKKHCTVIVIAAAFMLTSCAGPVEEAAEPELTVVETEAGEEVVEEAPEEPAGDGSMPEWADGAVDIGDKIGSTSTESWNVDVYQVGTATTTSDSMFVDSDSGDNLLPEGSEVVFLNFVVTNTTDETFNVGAGFASPDVRYLDWQYMGGMPAESSAEAYEGLGLANSLVKVGAIEDFDNVQLPIAPGQSIAVATNFLYTPGAEARVNLTLTPVDAEGDLDHDRAEKVDEDFTFTIE